MHQDAGTTGSARAPGLIVAAETRSSYGRRQAVLVSITGIVVLVLAAASWHVHLRVTDPVALAGWWTGTGTILLCAYAPFRGSRRRPLPTPAGRVVAIVAAYEQDTDDLHACVWSILNQRGVAVDEVHVVDGGSMDQPVQPFPHPRVRWHRMENGGKRAAQVYALDRLERDDWDFVLTVDGDCVLDERALEHQLKAFSRPRVTATTGMVIMRNAGQNLLTQIADVHIGTSYARRRVRPSLPGPLAIVPGAPAVYRAHVLFRHKHCYLTAGSHGDDRFLTMYARFEGEVVGINESIAWRRTPADAETVTRQLLDWWSSWWCLIPTALTGTNRLRGIQFRLFTFFRLVIGPLTIGYATGAITAGVDRGTLQGPTIFLYAALYLLLRYALTGLYLAERPATTWRRKLGSWLLLTPIEAAGNLLFVAPIKYIALLGLGWSGLQAWRDDRGTGPYAASAADPGTLYFSGYLPEEPITTTNTSAVLVGAVPASSGTGLIDGRGDGHE